MNNEIIGISFGLLLPILTLYNRKAKWLNSKVTWLTFFVFLSYGLYGLLYLKPILKNDKIFYFGFCIPIIYWIFDRFFKFLSIKINNRDFILYLRNSNEIDNSLFGKNPPNL